MHCGQDYKSIGLFKKQPIVSYDSQKALGMMFREIDPEPVFTEAKTFEGDTALCMLEQPGEYEQYVSVVAIFKAQYDFQLAGLLRQ